MTEVDNHFIKIFKALPLPSLLLMPDAPRFTITEANAAYFKTTGTTIADLVGKGIFEAFPVNPNKPIADGGKKLRASLLAAIETKQPHKMAAQHFDIPVRGSGYFEERYAEIENIPVLDDEGDVAIIIHTVTDVNEKIKAEELKTLLAKANRLAHIGSWELDVVKNTVYWSDITREIHEADSSYEPDAKTGASFYKEGKNRDLIVQKFTEAIETGAPWDDEFQIITVKGNEKWIRVIGESEFADGNCIRVYGSFQDIDARKKAEIAAIKTLEEKNTILESIGDAFFAVDKNWMVTYWNRHAEKVLHTPKSKAVGHYLWEVFYDNIGSASYKKYHQALETGQAVHFEDHHAALDKWYEISAYPSESGLSVYLKDVTETKKNVDKIKQSELRYRSLIEQATDAICIAIPNHTFIDANPTACRLLGYSKEEFLRLSLPDILLEEELKTNHLKVDEVAAGKTVRNERSVKRKDGTTMLMEVSTKMLADGNVVIFGRDITQRKALENQQSLFQSIVNSSDDAIISQTLAGMITSWNRGAETLFGYTEQYAIGKNISLIIPTDFIHEEQDIVASMKGGKQVIQYETERLKKDGSRISVSLTLSPIFDSNGNIIGASKIARDITEKRKAEENNRFKALLLNGVGQGVIAAELDGVITYWNKAAELIYGWTEEEAIGQNILRLIPAQQTKQQANAIIQQLLHGRSWSGEVIIQRKDGRALTIFTTNSPVYAPNGTIAGLMGVSFDMTERKKASEEIRYLANKLLLATKSAGVGIWDWDIVKGNLGWDEGMYRLYNINSWQFGSDYEGWISRLHPEDRDRVNEDIQMAITGKKEYQTEFRVIWDDQSVHYIKATGMIEHSGAGRAIRMIGANWDVTERRLTEIHLKALNENLQKHTKELALSNAELEQFAYVASHDLQEPLRMITSFLTQLDRKYRALIDDRGRRYIDFAVDGAKRMRQIILDLLEFSKIGRTGDIAEDLDLGELLGEIKILLRKKVEEKKAVITVGNLPVIHAYRSPVRQVFQNLIDNALKYAKADVAPRIAVSAKDKKDYWQFAVKDNSIGIDKEYFDKIFNIFQRLHNKDEYSGTGMGLAITKKIIENQGGKIWVESEEGKGSTFYFTLLKIPVTANSLQNQPYENG